MSNGDDTQTAPATALVSIEFGGDQILYIENNNEQFVPIKPVCEALGLAWQAQHRKLTDASERFSITMMVMETPAGPREMLCLPVTRLFGWLAGIHPSKVRPELRDKLTRYQRECDRVLAAHFLGQHSAREAERADREELLAFFFRNLRIQLLSRSTLLNKIDRLVEGGYWEGSIRAITGLRGERWDQVWDAMNDCGLIAPNNPDFLMTKARRENRTFGTDIPGARHLSASGSDGRSLPPETGHA